MSKQKRTFMDLTDIEDAKTLILDIRGAAATIRGAAATISDYSIDNLKLPVASNEVIKAQLGIVQECMVRGADALQCIIDEVVSART